MGLGSSEREDFTMRTVLQTAFASFAVLFVLACIGLVAAHQLAPGLINPDQYEFYGAFLATAYVGSILAAGLIAASIAASVFKK